MMVFYPEILKCPGQISQLLVNTYAVSKVLSSFLAEDSSLSFISQLLTSFLFHLHPPVLFKFSFHSHQHFSSNRSVFIYPGIYNSGECPHRLGFCKFFQHKVMIVERDISTSGLSVLLFPMDLNQY